MGKRIAVIGGTALQSLSGLKVVDKKRVTTPYGDCSDDLLIVKLDKIELVFLARHGSTHSIAPHKINYRANIWALHSLDVTQVVAISSVGGITDAFPPGTLAVPDQLIDYTHGRITTFYEDKFSIDRHIDFTEPYSASLRDGLLQAASSVQLPIHRSATVGITQGPRLETAAEIQRMAQDGCDLVGMTGMPEAVLAREIGLAYASLCIVVNWAAGIIQETITIEEIKETINRLNNDVERIIREFAKQD